MYCGTLGSKEPKLKFDLDIAGFALLVIGV